MTGGHAYIDESTRNDYLVVCSVVASGDADEARRALRGLLLAGQRSLHMKDERKPARQKLIIGTVCELRPAVTIYCAKPSEHKGHTGARDTCLQKAAADAVKLGLQRMVLDRNDTYVQRDKRSIILGSTSAGESRVPFTYDHMRRHEEPLLWIPDVVGWCYGRGGRLRAQVDPIVHVEIL